MKILGISSYFHDSAAALLVDGVVDRAAHEERFTRVKHDSQFPLNSIRFCIEGQRQSLSSLDAVVYYEKPLQKFDRIMESYIANAPWGLSHFLKSFPLWIKHKLFLRIELLKELRRIDPDFDESKLLFSEHHLSHAASAFYPSPFERALVVTFDGVGEWATTSVSIGNGSELKMMKEIHFPHSLGLLYSTLTSYLGFKVNSGEYKVMGLAPYGVPVYFERLLKELIELKGDGSYNLNLHYFDFGRVDFMHSRALEKLIGFPSRNPESLLNQDHMNLAASLQKLLEHILIHILTALKKEHPESHLCLAGGVALNCVANSKILKSGLFEDVWIQPAAGDAGGSWGAALAAHHLHFNQKRVERKKELSTGMFLGPSFSDSEIELACESKEIVFEKLSDLETLESTAEALKSGKIVGWFQGKMEFGPRALGSRSILADPRPADMQKRLNLKIKFRESFRPFAPIVREEDVSTYFDWSLPSPYMMFVAPVKESLRNSEPENVKSSFGIDRLNFQRSTLPSITHIDYTARLQTVAKEQNGRLHDLLTQFKKRTGCGVLVNTSFNVRGEPIVCSPRDAIECFLATDIDILVMGNYFIEKSNQTSVADLSKRKFEMD